MMVHFRSCCALCYSGFPIVRALTTTIDTRYLLLAPLATIILPIGTYFYGTTETITYDKMMEFSIILPVFAAMNQYLQALLERIPRKVKLPVIMYLSVCLFLIYAGIRCKGLYEVNNDGTGSIKWKQYDKANAMLKRLSHQKFHALVSNDNKFFFVLDNGFQAKSIDIIEHTEKPDLHNEHYDVLLLSKTSLQALPAESLSNYRDFPLDDENYLYLSRRFEQGR